MSLTDNPLAAQFKAFQGFVVKGFSWGGGRMATNCLCTLTVLKCILLGPLQRSEAHVVGNVGA